MQYVINVQKKFKLKLQKKIFKPNKNGELKILGSEYKTTLKSLNESNGWDLYLLAYNLEDYKIEQILMIKSSDINEECVIPRKSWDLMLEELGGKAVT